MGDCTKRVLGFGSGIAKRERILTLIKLAERCSIAQNIEIVNQQTKQAVRQVEAEQTMG